jgi:hypothetical protein
MALVPPYLLWNVLKRVEEEGGSKNKKHSHLNGALVVLALLRGKADPASSADFPSLA